MTIDEAIKILSDDANRGHSELYQRMIEAERLGIEALKRVKEDKEKYYYPECHNLPGETEEPKSTFPFYRKGGAVNSLGKVYQTTQGSQYPLVNDETDEVYSP